MDESRCNCQRPLACIVCRNCGFRLGKCRFRVRKPCSVHPNVSQLHLPMLIILSNFNFLIVYDAVGHVSS